MQNVVQGEGKRSKYEDWADSWVNGNRSWVREQAKNRIQTASLALTLRDLYGASVAFDFLESLVIS